MPTPEQALQLWQALEGSGLLPWFLEDPLLHQLYEKFLGPVPPELEQKPTAPQLPSPGTPAAPSPALSPQTYLVVLTDPWQLEAWELGETPCECFW